MANNIAVSITADVADLTAKMAVAQAVVKDAGKTMRDVAKEVASGDTSAATRTQLLAVSDAYSKAAATAAMYGRELKGSRVVQGEATVSSGQQKFAMRDLGYQIQDLGTQFSMAAQSSDPFKMALMAITQQSPQVIQSIQLMRGEAGGFIGFLGGPWGAGIMAATAILGNLAYAHLSAGKAAQTQESADEDLSKALDVLHDKAVQATASIEDGIRASLADAFAKRSQAAETLKAAQAELELRRAKAGSAAASVSPGAPGYSNMYNIGESAKQDALADEQSKRIAKLQGDIGKGTESIRGFQAEIAKIHIEQQFDAGAAASARYSQRVSDLARSYRDGKISLEEYSRATRAARIEQQQAEDAAKKNTDPAKRREAKGDKGPDEVSVWAEELHNQQILSNDYFSDQTQTELDFWKTKVALTIKGSKEWLAVQSHIFEASKQLARAAQQEQLAGNRQAGALAAEQARSEIDLSKIALQSKLEDIDAEQRMGRISAAQALQQRAAFNQQILQLDADLEMRLYAAKLLELRQDQAGYKSGTREYRDYTRQIEILNQQHINRMALMKAQADAKQRQADRLLATESNRRMQGMSNTWASNLARMATLQQGFSATIGGLWQGVQNLAAGIIEEVLQKWITAELVKIGLMKVTSTSSIASEAAKAGAGGTASMAAAPFPINLTAPAFGASMSAAAMAYNGMNAFAQGTNVLPNDMIAQIHAGERIVPKADNDTLIELTKRGAGMGEMSGPMGGHAGGSGAGGDNHNHFHFHGAVMNSKRELKRFAEGSAAELSAAGKKYARNNGR